MNLDDDQERDEFLEAHNTRTGRSVANALGLKGPGADKLATALSNYAWNKHTAVNCRIRGDIQVAMQYEAICDRIYSEQIQPVCEWKSQFSKWRVPANAGVLFSARNLSNP